MTFLVKDRLSRSPSDARRSDAPSSVEMFNDRSVPREAGKRSISQVGCLDANFTLKIAAIMRPTAHGFQRLKQVRASKRSLAPANVLGCKRTKLIWARSYLRVPTCFWVVLKGNPKVKGDHMLEGSPLSPTLPSLGCLDNPIIFLGVVFKRSQRTNPRFCLKKTGHQKGKDTCLEGLGDHFSKHNQWMYLSF